MNQQFFEKILPTQGNLCVTGISKEGIVTPRFADSVDSALDLIDQFKAKGLNVYFTPGSYEAYRRKQEECVAVRSFFLDLDVEHGKSKYDSKEDALNDVERFRREIDWPEPVLVDSGGGIHAYWIFDEDLPADEWSEYARNFKQLCIDHHLVIDPGVPADSARLMRVPDTLNYRYDPPKAAMLLSEEIVSYPVETFLPLLERSSSAGLETGFDFDSVEKGLDEDTKRIWEERQKNFEYSFEDIVIRSLEGDGCKQIANAVLNAADLPEPEWYAAVSVAIRCKEGMEAVHKLSEDYSGYDPQETERKAKQSLENATGAHSCEAFANLNPDLCKGCQHRGKFGKAGPLMLGKIIRIAEVPSATTDEAQPVREEADTGVLKALPDFLLPYVRAANGGIYYTPPIKYDKDGKARKEDPVMITPFDLYATQRVYSPLDGECLMMKLILPRDGCREFLLPMKDVASLERLKVVLATNGVVFEPQTASRLASYLMKWSTYLINTERADKMHLQQGWTEGCKSFILGSTEYERTGTRNCPPSPLARNVSRFVVQKGSFDEWQERINYLDNPGYERHAFMFLCGLASPLMEFANVNGITVCALGPNGTGKTGSIYAGISSWGSPSDLVISDYTENAGTQRMLGLKNLPFGLDEQSNMAPKEASDLLYKVSAGRGKLRMQASTNSERVQEYMTKLICLISANQSIKQKVGLYKEDATAEEMRLLEMTFSKPTSPGYVMDAERGLWLFEGLKNNYGHAGPMLIQHILGMPRAKFDTIFEEERARSSDLFEKNSEYRFLNGLNACVYTAGRIGNDMGLFKLNLDKIREVVEDDYRLMMKIRVENQTRHLDLLNEFIAENVRSVLVVKDSGGIGAYPTLGVLNIRVETGKNRMYVTTASLKNYLHPKQITVKAFEDDLKKQGVMLQKIKKRMATGWTDGIEANVYAYEFDLDKVTSTFDGFTGA